MIRKTVFVLSLLLVCGVIPCLVEAQVSSSASPSAPSQPYSWSLSPIEIAVIAVIIVAVAGVVGFALYQRTQLRSIQKQTALLKAKTAELRARQGQTRMKEPGNVCRYCRAPVDEEAAFCPVCRRALR